MELWLLKRGSQVPRERSIDDNWKSSTVHKLNWICASVVNRKSAVGTVTCYGLDGPGIESRPEWGFPHPSRLALGPIQPPIQWVPRLFRGVKRPGCDVDHLPSYSTEAKERVELYFSSASGYSCPVLGRILPLCAIVTTTCMAFIAFSVWWLIDE